jgi:hypothetical protein
MHDIVIVGIPLVAILAGILFGRNDIKELSAEMNARFDKVDQRFDVVDDRFEKINADLRQFYHLTGRLEGRMDAIEKRS